jgi:hypothetical protein
MLPVFVTCRDNRHRGEQTGGVVGVVFTLAAGLAIAVIYA